MFNDIITNISLTEDLALITVAGIPADGGAAAEILTGIAEKGKNVDMITQTPPYNDVISLSFTVAEEDLSEIVAVVGGAKKIHPSLRTDVNPGNSKIMVFSEKMVETPGVAASMFRVLHEAGIRVKLITTSDVDISVLVGAADGEGAVVRLQETGNN